jgi:hypothetical protein
MTVLVFANLHFALLFMSLMLAAKRCRKHVGIESRALAKPRHIASNLFVLSAEIKCIILFDKNNKHAKRTLSPNGRKQRRKKGKFEDAPTERLAEHNLPRASSPLSSFSLPDSSHQRLNVASILPPKRKRRKSMSTANPSAESGCPP